MTDQLDSSSLHPAAVLLPTTGEIVRIVGVKSRPRLASSYAAIVGDFRPLKLSADYHRFVTGPLTQILDPGAAGGDGPFELSLSGEIDTGRSWELPTLVAHLLNRAGRLVACPAFDAGDEEGDDDPLDSDPPTIVWATGKVDPDLAPQSDDYAIKQKCALSKPQLEAWRDKGHRFRFVVPAGLPDDDRKEIAELAAAFRAPVSEAASLQAVADAIGVDLTDVVAGQVGNAVATRNDQGQAGAAAVSPEATGRGSAKPWPGRIIAAGAVAAIVAGIAYVGAGPSGPSIFDGDSGQGRQGAKAMPAITMSRLFAEDRAGCINRIMVSAPLQEAAIAEGDSGFDVPHADGLCGLRLRNSSGATLTLGLSAEFQPFTIRGDNALFRGVEVAAGDKIDLVFSRAPSTLSSTLSISTPGDGSWQTPVRITGKTSDGQ